MLAGVNDPTRRPSRSRELLDPRRLQGQPDPVQPDGRLRRLLARRDRRLPGRARGARPARDGPAHARPRHRRRLRPARREGPGRGGLVEDRRAADGLEPVEVGAAAVELAADRLHRVRRRARAGAAGRGASSAARIAAAALRGVAGLRRRPCPPMNARVAPTVVLRTRRARRERCIDAPANAGAERARARRSARGSRSGSTSRGERLASGPRARTSRRSRRRSPAYASWPPIELDLDDRAAAALAHVRRSRPG